MIELGVEYAQITHSGFQLILVLHGKFRKDMSAFIYIGLHDICGLWSACMSVEYDYDDDGIFGFLRSFSPSSNIFQRRSKN